MKTVRLLIKAKPERAGAVRAQLASLHGVKVHAVTPEGRVFVTIERENERHVAQEIEDLSRSPDVLDWMEVDGKEDSFPDSTSSRPRVDPRAGPRRPWYVRLILALQRRKYGAELEASRLWGRLPRSFLLLTLLYRTLDRADSPLEPGLRALVQLRISQINWCAFCVDLMSASAIERAVAPDQLEALAAFEESALFSGREKAALAYAQAVTDPARPVDPPVFERLRAHFGEQEILELTALAAFQNMTSKFNAALSVPPQGFCTRRAAARR